MADDLKRAKRIADVLHLIERVSRSELVESERALDNSKRAHNAAMECLTGEEFLGGPFVDFVAKRLPKLSAAVERQAQARDAAELAWRGRRMRVLASSELVKQARAADAKEQEKRDLQDVIEAILSNRETSLG